MRGLRINFGAETARNLILTILLAFIISPVYLFSQVTADFNFIQHCDSLEFNNLSQAQGVAVITGYIWDFGDGDSSDVIHPNHTYLIQGSYAVTMKVYFDDGGETDSLSTVKWVHYFLPVASFTANQLCFGNSTEFLSTATTNPNTPIDPMEMIWDFENDGINTATGANVYHTYDSPGIKDVFFQVTNSVGCIHDTIQTLEVFPNPVASFSIIPGCPMSESLFMDESQPNAPGIDSWEWDFGDGSPHSYLQNPGHYFMANGVFNVTLAVVNSNGCIDDTIRSLVIEKPVADFEFNVVCEGKTTLFTDLSTFDNLPVTSWQWDFGDMSGTSSQQNPSYVYANSGLYDVELIVGNDLGCYDTVVFAVLVDSLPIAGFTHSSSCVGVQTCFTDTSVANAASIVSWLWTFGDGTSSILQNPCHTYSDSGSYNVSLVVTNSNGCESEPYVTTIFVAYKPQALFSNTSECFGGTTFFTNLTDTMGMEVAFWAWNFGDPASGDDNISDLHEPSHNFTEPGSFLVQMTVENIYGCSDFYEQTVVVNPNPVAMFIHPDTVAIGAQITITDLSTGVIIDRLWDFGDGSTAININPVIYTYSEPGNYTICVNVVDFFGCSDQYCHDITIVGLPEPYFTYASDMTLETFFFDESQPTDNIIDWHWDFGDPAVSNDTVSGVPNPMWQYNEEGWYSVKLVVFDKYGGINEIIRMVYAGNAVMAGFDNFAVCLGDTTFFVDYSTSPISTAIETWYWDFGDGTDTLYFEPADTIIHRYILPGVYEVRLAVSAYVSGFFMSDTAHQTIEIFENPVARIKDQELGVCFGKPINFKDASVYAPGDPGKSWFWDFRDGNFSTLKNPVHQYSDTGSYQVILQITTQKGCVGIDSVSAYVSESPKFGFQVVNNCLNSPAQFIPVYDSSKITITSWNWNFGDNLNPDNTSTTARPYHTYNRIDVYEVTMEMEAFGCPGQSTKTILIYPIPYSGFDFTANYEGIQGRTKFENQSVLSENFLWDFGNGNTSTVEDPIEIFEFDSTYTITLISYNEYACSDTSRQTLSVFFRGLYFPTAFSPNNPNREVSLFTPKGINLKEFNVQVFDQRGNLMWESEKLDSHGSPVESWDGYTKSGVLMPQGMYVWKARGKFRDGSDWRGQSFNGEEPQTSGVVTLIH